MLGALTGLGGGVILIPAMVLGLDVNIFYAMGASLISIIANSSGTAIAYLREGYTNLRIGMLLETGAVIGAVIGAYLILLMPTRLITIIFGLVLLLSAYLSIKRKEESENHRSSHSWAVYLKLEDNYPTPHGLKHYHVQRVPLAWVIMFIAGILSSLLGVGSGALKVLAMDQVMRLPYKVATATSNFIIGITAAVSAGIYFSRGYVDPVLTFPVVVGVLLGSISGAKILHRANIKTLRLLFSLVIILLAIEMIYKGVTGSL